MSRPAPRITDAGVARVFDAAPPEARRRLMALRAIIYDTAAATEGVGPLDETLKWGEPAYVTTASRSGSTVRLGWKASAPTRVAVYFHCQTTLVDTFRTLFPNEFRFEGRRAIVFEAADEIPADALGVCIAAALTYHRRAGPRPKPPAP